LTAFPAIHIDFAILHGLQADAYGDVKLNNNLGIDMELVYAADNVIVTVEEIVDRVQKSTDGPILPAPGANMIVHIPRGAWPTSCYPLYPVDGAELIRYTESDFDTYLQTILT
jgi:glutaconate CoA-transferase, subunit A